MPRDKSGASVFVEISGSEESKNLARDMILEICDSANEFGGGGGGRGGGFGRSRDMGPSRGFPDGNVMEVEVPSADIGRVIGEY